MKAIERFDVQRGLTVLAGVLYLAIILSGLISQIALRGPLIVSGDPKATAQALNEGALALRASVVADSVMMLCDVAIAVVFFHILRPFAPLAALLAMCFRLTQAAMIGAFLILPMAVIGVDGAFALQIMELHAIGYDMALIPFGVNTLIMAWLLHRAGAPRVLQPLLFAAGAVYLLGSLSRIIAPDLNEMMQPAYLVAVVAETSLCLWLLFGRGITPPRALDA